MKSKTSTRVASGWPSTYRLISGLRKSSTCRGRSVGGGSGGGDGATDEVGHAQTGEHVEQRDEDEVGPDHSERPLLGPRRRELDRQRPEHGGQEAPAGGRPRRRDHAPRQEDRE